MHGYGTLKPVGVILEWGVGKERIMEGMNQARVPYMYIWKFHSEIPCITIIH
jgi:hypothetical protein